MKPAPQAARAFDVQAVRRDFPILAQEVHGHPLVYLDNAATTQKPRAVIDEISRWYAEDCSNVHRGVHAISARATASFEAAREKVRRFLNAGSEREIVFVRGTTEALNLVARSFAAPRLRAGDEILVTGMEHHSNIVPWQMLCGEVGAHLKVVPVTDAGELDLEALHRLLGPRTRMLGVVHLSNALGTINPVKRICAMARERGVPVVVDGAQALAHLAVDVQDLGCDFYCFSGHKFYGPTGIGVLWGREEHLEAMPPYQGGGDMILSVSFEKTVYNRLPFKFEAGTPNVAGAVGLGAAIDYVEAVGLEPAAAHEAELLARATDAIRQVEGVRIIGTAREKASVLSFVVDGVHPHDIGTVLDERGVAVRTGHHCAQPLMQRFGLPATARASFAMYNTIDEVDVFVRALDEGVRIFR